MSRLDRIKRQEASIAVEKALAILEDEFVAKKIAGSLTREDRLELRAARQHYRDNLRQPKEGAQPAAIGTQAIAKGVG